MSDKKSWRESGQGQAVIAVKSGPWSIGSGGISDGSIQETVGRLFDKGDPESLKGKLPAGHSEAERAAKLLRDIRESKGGKALEKSVNAFLKEYDLPEDPVWLRCLEHSRTQCFLNRFNGGIC